jgi:haloalkane dehalogenase
MPNTAPTPPDGPGWQALYPFESRFVEIGGHRLHYLDEGRGPVLLLVHGNPTWSFYWRELVAALRSEYRVIVPDHIGCGLSDKPDRRTYPYRLQRRVDDLLALIEHLDLREITLVAHDWGGAIGLGAAVADAARFSRFVLLNTGAFRSKHIPWRIALCRAPLLGRLGVQGLNLFARAAVHMAVARPERMTDEVRAGLLAPYDRWSSRVAIHQFVLDIPLRPIHPSYAALTRIEHGLPRLADRPVCLIWGMRDWCFTPHFLDRFLDFFPRAEVHRLADAGHYVVEDAHEEIVPILRRFVPQGETEG